MTEQGVGYQILELRVQTLERELKDVKNDLKDHTKLTGTGFTEINDRVDDLSLIVNEVKLITKNFTTIQSEMKDSFGVTQKEMKDSLSETIKELKDDIKEIAQSAGKDTKWVALTKEIIKAIILLAGIVATGKWIG